MNFRGDSTLCVVPSRQGVFNLSHLPSSVAPHPFVGQCRARDAATQP